MLYLPNLTTKALAGLGVAILAMVQVANAASHAFLNYDAPKAGQTVQLTFDSYTGPLDNVTPVYAHVGFNGWTEVYDAPMHNIFAGTHTLNINVPLHATQLNVVFHNNAGVWDNNGNADWNFAVTPSRATIQPAAPAAGQNATVTYNPAGGPLASATAINLHHGFNGWTNVGALPLTKQGNVWTATVPMAATATVFDFVFNNGQGVWDNNAGADWHVAVEANSGQQTVTLSPTAQGQGSVSHHSAYGMHTYYRDYVCEWSSFTHRDEESAFLRFNVAQLPNAARIDSIKLRYTAEMPGSTHSSSGSIQTKIHTFGNVDTFFSSDAVVNGVFHSAPTLMTTHHNSQFPIVSANAQTFEFNAAVAGDLSSTLAAGTDIWTLGFGLSLSTGRLILRNPELIVTYSEGAQPFQSNYDSISVAGNFNGWNAGAANMTLVGDHLWMGTFNFGQMNNVELKFTANGTWATNWGDNAQGVFFPSFSSTADSFGANVGVYATQGMNYYIAFDELLNVYSINR